MFPVSIVIISKNEAAVIDRCIRRSRLITDDVVVVDSGSTDNTRQIVKLNGGRFYESPWQGYGANKNEGIALAKYDWILSIDADEMPDDVLISSLQHLDPDDIHVVYDIKFRSYFGQKLIRFGSWGRDHHIRLFNRRLVRWSETMVHEKLLLPENVIIKKIEGNIIHHSVNDIAEYRGKSSRYASLCASQYFKNGQKPGFIKLYFSPFFGFVKNYLFLLGFLDGREGWQIAKVTYQDTRHKYRLLKTLITYPPTQEVRRETLVAEY